jgi:hypothetical protein
MTIRNTGIPVRKWPPMPAAPSLDTLPRSARERIAEFNARPMRRHDDLRICGWSVMENES